MHRVNGKIMQGIDLFSGVGGMSIGAIASGIDVRHAVELDKWAAAVNVRKVYGERALAMGAALKRERGHAIEFTQPQDGLFFWARLTGAGGKTMDAAEFAKKAIEQGVAFGPGAPFYAESPDLSTFRLSFATADVGKIEKAWGDFQGH